jgi:hypothetical protein
VAWHTHKYITTADGEDVLDKMGSNKRTHFYVIAHTMRPFGQPLSDIAPVDMTRTADSGEQAAEAGCVIVDLYHTTMWWSGTWSPGSKGCPSSRLLVKTLATIEPKLMPTVLERWRDLQVNESVNATARCRDQRQ